MSLFRVAALLIMCGIALSAVGKPSAPQNSATKQATQPEIAKSIAESVSGTLQFAEGNFLGVAEAMPEDKYSYIPAGGNFDGVRSFGEQVKHVACAQFAFFNEFEGKKPPDDCERGGHDPAKTNAELIKYLKSPSTTPTVSSPCSRRTMRSTVSKAAMPDRTPNWASRSLRSGTLPTITDS